MIENNDNQFIDVRESKLLRSYLMPYISTPNQLVESFTNIFNNFTDFSDQIASIKLYPISAVEKDLPDRDRLLDTGRVFPEQIIVRRIKQAYIYRVGQIEIETYYDSFLDYKGYTFLKLYLPFLGIIDVDVNEVMGKWLQIYLAVDFTTGIGTYYIGASVDSFDGEVSVEDSATRIFASYECEVGVDIPIGSSNFGDVMRNTILGTVKTVATVGASIYSGTMLPPTTTTSKYNKVTVKGAVFKKGKAKNAPKGTRLKLYDVKTSEPDVENAINVKTTDKPFNISEPIKEAVDGSISILSRSQPTTQSDRNLSPANNTFVELKAVLFIYRPNVLYDNEYYKKYYGLPYGGIIELNKCKGFTKVSSIHLENIPYASSAELEMIKEYLYNGVILPE